MRKRTCRTRRGPRCRRAATTATTTKTWGWGDNTKYHEDDLEEEEDVYVTLEEGRNHRRVEGRKSNATTQLPALTPITLSLTLTHTALLKNRPHWYPYHRRWWSLQWFPLRLLTGWGIWLLADVSIVGSQLICLWCQWLHQRFECFPTS